MQREQPRGDRRAEGEVGGEELPEHAHQLAPGQEVREGLVPLLIVSQDRPGHDDQEYQGGQPQAGVPGDLPGRAIGATVEDPSDVADD